MEVKTRVGVINCPEPAQITERTKFWAEAIFELIRVNELYGVMGAALDEAFQAGARSASAKLLGLGRVDIIDAEFTVVEAGSEEPASSAEGSEHPQSASPDQGSESTEPPPATEQLPGSLPEVPECERED